MEKKHLKKGIALVLVIAVLASIVAICFADAIDGHYCYYGPKKYSNIRYTTETCRVNGCNKNPHYHNHERSVVTKDYVRYCQSGHKDTGTDVTRGSWQCKIGK